MKKLMIVWFLLGTLAFSLEILSIDPINFGVVVEGDKSVSLSDVGIYVDGRAGKDVELVIPDSFDIDGNNMKVKVREKIIKLDGNGRGRFRIDLKLDLDNVHRYDTITDKLSIKVRYLD